MMNRRWLATGLWVATLAASAVALALIAVNRDVSVPTSWGFRGASVVFGLTCGTIGFIVALRRPDNLNGWLFCAIGLLFAAEGFVDEYVIASVLVVSGGLPWTSAMAWLLAWMWAPAIGIALIYLPLFFPTGHLLSPRWRGVVVLGTIALVLFSAALGFLPGAIEQATFVDNPLGLTGIPIETYANVILGPIWLVLGTSMALAFASLAIRFRRAPVEARQQIKWFGLAVLGAATTEAIYFTISVVTISASTTKVLEMLVIVSLLSLPTAAGMAILRYRLYDIDRIVSRTISYGVITALLVAVFLVVNLALQAALSSVTSSNAWAVAASTLLAAALFTPVRRRVQQAVDRRFDRARYDAERLTVAFADRLRDEVDLSTLGLELDATVRRAIAPSSVGLWLRGGR